MTASRLIVWILIGALLGWLALVGIDSLMGSDADDDGYYLAGECVTFSDGFESSIEGRSCGEPHTHVVVAVATDESRCPAGTDATWVMREGANPVRCLAAEK